MKTVTGISGKVGDTVDVTVPTKEGYTPDKSIVSGVIQPDGSVKVTDTITYTGDPITNGSASIPTNDGKKTVTGISGKVGDTVDVIVPNKDGYTPDKNTVSGVIQPDGSVKVTDIVTYTGNSITNGSASIATNNGDKTVTGISGKVGDTVEITVPTKDGYTPDKTTVSGIIQPDGSIKVIDDVTYTGNSITSGSASISTNDGDKTVTGISGKVGDTVDVTVPTKEGYTPDKSIVSGVIQPDGSVKVTDTITYTGVDNPSQTLTVKNPDGTISQLLIPAGKYGDGPISVTAKEMSGYKAPSVIVTYNANGIPTITDAIDTSKSILETDELSYTKNPSHGSGTVKPVISNPGEGTIEHKTQTISTYSDKPDVELYQLGADNKMAPITSRYLATASNWYSDATITIDGISYFRVATNEWAKVGEVYPYQALNLHIRTYDDSEKDLYKAENVLITKETLAPDSSWITDRETYVINNTKYYRVATNEFVNADDVYVYSPVNMVVTTHADKYTPLYTAKGAEVTNRTLSNNTSWKVDSVTYINGDKYYRVATNEFVKASDVDVENYH